MVPKGPPLVATKVVLNGHGSSSCIMIISRSRDNCSCVLSPLIGILLSYTLFNFHFFKLNQSCLEFLLVDQFFFNIAFILPAVLPVLRTTRIRTPGVGAVFVTMLVPVGWNGTLYSRYMHILLSEAAKESKVLSLMDH